MKIVFAPVLKIKTHLFSSNVEGGVLTLWKPLDYESVSQYTFTFSVRDDHLRGKETKTLTLNVENANEKNWMEASVPSITFKENAVSWKNYSGKL